MGIWDAIINFWDDLTGLGKAAVIFLIVLIVIVTGSGWFDSWTAMREVKRIEREAARQEQTANDALANAAKIARQLQEKQAELTALESKRNEKQFELDRSIRDSRDADADYRRSRREPRTDNPDINTLCRELGELGYRCE